MCLAERTVRDSPDPAGTMAPRIAGPVCPSEQGISASGGLLPPTSLANPRAAQPSRAASHCLASAHFSHGTPRPLSPLPPLAPLPPCPQLPPGHTLAGQAPARAGWGQGLPAFRKRRDEETKATQPSRQGPLSCWPGRGGRSLSPPRLQSRRTDAQLRRPGAPEGCGRGAARRSPTPPPPSRPAPRPCAVRGQTYLGADSRPPGAGLRRAAGAAARGRAGTARDCPEGGWQGGRAAGGGRGEGTALWGGRQVGRRRW